MNPTQPSPEVGSGLVLSAGGIMQAKNLTQVRQDERAEAERQNAKPYITNLAGHIRKQWDRMQSAKRENVEPRLLKCLRQRRGEYDPETQSQIKQQGGSSIYLMLSSNKARAASSWIRDVMTDEGGRALPYSVSETPDPDLPPDVVQRVYMQIRMELEQAAALGIQPSEAELEQYLTARKQEALNEVREIAAKRAENMKTKMDDQLAEGDFLDEFNKFIDDMTTFPYAVMKGPVVKRRKAFHWVQGMGGEFELDLQDELLPTWERVDPFMLYWSSHCTNPDDGDLIERHRLTRAELNELRGVDGYSDSAIAAVLEDYGRGGLHEWLWIDGQKATAEGKNLSEVMSNSDGLIDALQFWGSVQGSLLIEWGLEDGTVEDPLKDYPVELWLIGNWVIKATINPDPLGRKPYYKAAYEEVPGSWLGNSPMDLIRDCQDVCNAAARALVNNMGISSGPQVWVNVSRLPDGEDITQMYPWKIWQFTSDMANTSAPPIDFFQPNSLANELMAIYERFSVLADEYSGVPRYMTGDTPAGGAGRTASGMSMLMNNAGKAIKQVIANIDRNVIHKVVERLWMFNMKYGEDPELKGDVKIVARGANALIVKEAAAQRRNELLQMALSNPIAQQIIGMEGTAQLMREQVKTLDMNPDKIVPAPEVVKARAMVQQALQQQAMMAQQAQANPQQGPMPQSEEALMDGSPVTDVFQPMRTA